MRSPLLTWTDADGTEQRLHLTRRDRPVTIGRRAEADVALPHDLEVSRLHAELQHRAGEWAIADGGLSQNGTFVNELRVEGRRRLADGDEIRVGRTRIAFSAPAAPGDDVTLLPGDLAPAGRLSEQQRIVLRALCRPLFGDGDGVETATDDEIADETGVPLAIVRNEVGQLVRSFGLGGLPGGERRAELALRALRAGLVGREDFEGQAG